jgi:hypothetical protein
MTYAQGRAGAAQSQWGRVVNYEYYEMQECAAEKGHENVTKCRLRKAMRDENEPKCTRVCPHRVSLFYRFVLHEGRRSLGWSRAREPATGQAWSLGCRLR